MKRQDLLSAWVLGTLATGMAFIFGLGPLVVYATSTTTVVGWLIPDGTHWNNGIGAFLFPLIGAALFAMMARVMDLEKNVPTMALIGLTMGSVLGMLSLGNSTAGNALPFALPIVASVDLLLYLWRGGD